MHQEYFPWCGATVAYCIANAGLEPVFGGSDTKRFLWAESWLDEGVPVETPEPGDIVVFDFGAGDQHVTLFENDLGNGHWECLGGNQSHQVKLSTFSKKSVVGVRRPSMRASSPAPQTSGLPGARFSNCVGLVLDSEGGNVDDPIDPGGRTSRGITQGDWDKWRLTRPGLPVDVFQAPPDQILAIYHDDYWDAVEGDQLPTGVDYAVFDCGVLNGVGTAAKILQARLGVKVDGDIGEKTISACLQADGATLINHICDDRLQRMEASPLWANYGKGWANRVNRVRADALKMIGASVSLPASTPVSLPSTPGNSSSAPAISDDLARQLLQELRQLGERVSNMKDAPPQTLPVPIGSAPADQAALARWVQQALTNFQALSAKPQGAVAAQAPALDQVKQFVNMLAAQSGLQTTAAKAETTPSEALGQVNGALGQTIGNLLNGKKSAIGIIGAAATSILSAAPADNAIGRLAADGIGIWSGFSGAGTAFLPVFLAIAAWGVLGKMEKWTAASASTT
jgi:uncharacterized protein (TIGR02594 family)